MTSTEYLLFRLNFVDRHGLFDQPVRTDNQVINVFETAARERCDVVDSRTRSGSRWSLRQVETDTPDEPDARPFISAIFSHEATYREGPIVTPAGISRGVSAISPPAATTSHVVVDLRRHIIAVQDVAAIMQTKPGWKNKLELILNAGARWAEYTSRVSLEPIAPKQVVQGRLAEFNRITRVRVTLRIPNPDLGPTFQRLYEEMSRGGVRELTEDMRSERGLDFSTDSLPRASLDMALNGYRKGEIRIYGFREGNEKDKFTIADDVARVEIDGLRDFVSGVRAGTTSPEVKRVVHAIIRKIDGILPSRKIANE